MISRIAALPLWVKVALGVIALLVSILLSPLMVVVALFVLVIAILALIYKALRRRSLKRWGLVALTSLILIIVFSGITYALFPTSQREQASTPTKSAEEETKEETKEETPTKDAEEAEPEEEDAAKEEDADDASSTPAASDADEEDSDSGGHDATVRVKRVVDGDTIRISPAIDGIDEVRLIGVDTPETKEPGCDVQPYGTEASEFTTEELQGEEIDLEFDEDREDRYDRLLAYVYKDEEMFNETLLEEGYAQVYIVDPNDKYEDRFEEAQAEAQAAQRGIWALPPADLALLTDRGNAIGGSGCAPKATPPPKAPPPPQPPPEPVSAPDPTPNVRTPNARPAPAAPTPSSGADCSTGVSNVPVVPGSKGDGDGDGIACEKR